MYMSQKIYAENGLSSWYLHLDTALKDPTQVFEERPLWFYFKASTHTLIFESITETIVHEATYQSSALAAEAS